MVVPRRRLDPEHDSMWRDDRTGPLEVVPSKPGDGVYLRCVIAHPPSSEGRAVTVWFDPRTADELLLVLRDNARERRR